MPAGQSTASPNRQCLYQKDLVCSPLQRRQYQNGGNLCGRWDTRLDEDIVGWLFALGAFMIEYPFARQQQ
jgi:hypothetical protein